MSLICTKIPEKVTIKIYKPFSYLQIEAKHIMNTEALSYKKREVTVFFFAFPEIHYTLYFIYIFSYFTHLYSHCILHCDNVMKMHKSVDDNQ